MEPSSSRPYWTTVESSYSNFSTHFPSAVSTTFTTWSKKPWFAVKRSFFSSYTVRAAGIAPADRCKFRKLNCPEAGSTRHADTFEAGFLGPRPSVFLSSTA